MLNNKSLGQLLWWAVFWISGCCDHAVSQQQKGVNRQRNCLASSQILKCKRWIFQCGSFYSQSPESVSINYLFGQGSPNKKTSNHWQEKKGRRAWHYKFLVLLFSFSCDTRNKIPSSIC